MDKKYEQVKQILAKYNQEQLLTWYEKLIEQKKEELLDQILKIDFEQIKTLYEETQQQKDFKKNFIFNYCGSSINFILVINKIILYKKNFFHTPT